MELLDFVLDTPAEQLACDQALLEACDGEGGPEVLRFWESARPFIVLGYANAASAEVDLDACRARGIPVLRRCSGGGTVLQGPGCLNYALILRTTADGPLSTITGTTAQVMQRHAAALQPFVSGTVTISGYSDLAIDGMKFSGNAQRRALRSVLVHGTFLLDFDIASVEGLLRMPSRQPVYRRSRPHGAFMLNIPVARETIRFALASAWQARAIQRNAPADRIRSLARERYMTDEWTFRR
jgi:lipoate---protein ligase